MADELRSLVSKKLTVVGVHLRVIWQKTLTSSLALKQALSPPPSPDSANFPTVTIRSNDGPARETVLPVFDRFNLISFELGPKHADLVRSSGGHSIVPGAPAADSSNTTTERPITTTKHAESQTEDLRKVLVDSGSMTYDTTHTYTDAVTQTEPFTPGSVPTSGSADDQDNVKLDGLSGTDSEVASPNEVDLEAGSCEDDGNVLESLKVPGGPCRMVVTKHDSEDCPALLVTKQVIWRLEGISEETRKVERLETKVERLERNMHGDLFCVRDNEYLLEDATSQEEIDRLREIIADLRGKITPQEERLEALKGQLVAAKQDVAYLEGLFRDSFEKVLVDTGLLKIRKEHTDNEARESEDSSESQPDLYPDEISPIQSDTSEISLEELNRRAVGAELRTRHLELLEAEHEFDLRQDNYDLTKARYWSLVRAGECEMTPTEFDHCDVEVTRELTRDLRLAEEAYEEALARRNALGPNEEDQESGFLDDQDDGYRLSFENDGPASAPTGLIRKWLEGIPDVENLPDMEALETAPNPQCEQAHREGLEDCDIRSAQMSDGWSCHDLTRNRRRIDRWRAVTGRDR
ncbi:MAG: hypothetical protein LQ349_000149 [Xanthoria aureola]|nr:MAG: hypothetical protein LQ349_000149 [Xanthoria aureola]